MWNTPPLMLISNSSIPHGGLNTVMLERYHCLFVSISTCRSEHHLIFACVPRSFNSLYALQQSWHDISHGLLLLCAGEISLIRQILHAGVRFLSEGSQDARAAGQSILLQLRIILGSSHNMLDKLVCEIASMFTIKHVAHACQAYLLFQLSFYIGLLIFPPCALPMFSFESSHHGPQLKVAPLIPSFFSLCISEL